MESYDIKHALMYSEGGPKLGLKILFWDYKLPAFGLYGPIWEVSLAADLFGSVMVSEAWLEWVSAV